LSMSGIYGTDAAEARPRSAQAQNQKRRAPIQLMKLVRAYTAAVAICTGMPGIVHGQTADTLFTERPLFVSSDALLAAGFVAATAAIAPADKWMTRQLRDEARQANRMLKVGSSAARIWGNPGTLIAGGGMYLLGSATSNRRIQDLGLHSAGAVVVSNLITVGIKAVAGRARPFVDSSNAMSFGPFRGIRDDAYRSFPSGHATAAFAFASVVTAETSHWWPDGRWPVGVLTYGTATLTALSRIYNDQHWASDVMAGAAIGTITGLKLFRYQHSHPDNKIDRTLLRAGLQSSSGRWSLMIGAVKR
jgi:membrane-associated phospholipid phosphatase